MDLATDAMTTIRMALAVTTLTLIAHPDTLAATIAMDLATDVTTTTRMDPPAARVVPIATDLATDAVTMIHMARLAVTTLTLTAHLGTLAAPPTVQARERKLMALPTGTIYSDPPVAPQALQARTRMGPASVTMVIRMVPLDMAPARRTVTLMAHPAMVRTRRITIHMDHLGTPAARTTVRAREMIPTDLQAALRATLTARTRKTLILMDRPVMALARKTVILMAHPAMDPIKGIAIHMEHPGTAPATATTTHMAHLGMVAPLTVRARERKPTALPTETIYTDLPVALQALQARTRMAPLGMVPARKATILMGHPATAPTRRTMTLMDHQAMGADTVTMINLVCCSPFHMRSKSSRVLFECLD